MNTAERSPLDPAAGSPVFVSAGVLKTPHDLEAFRQITEPDFWPTLTAGSFTWDEWSGNKGGNSKLVDFDYDPSLGAAHNALGLPNPGQEGLNRLKPIARDMQQDGRRLIVSVTNLPHEPGLEVLPKLAEKAMELQPTAIEINLSCPNGRDTEGNLHPPICNDPELSRDLLAAVRRRIGRSAVLLAKDSPHAKSLQEGVAAHEQMRTLMAIDDYIDGVTGINTIGGQPAPKLTVPGGKGGMSGPIVRPIAHDWLVNARGALSKDKIILACGGIDKKNVGPEATIRRQVGALLIGGAQEFYRASNPARLATEWARRIVEYGSDDFDELRFSDNY